VEVHADDIIGHIVLDLFFLHRYSFTASCTLKHR
jgi:hypothetical protein